MSRSGWHRLGLLVFCALGVILFSADSEAQNKKVNQKPPMPHPPKANVNPKPPMPHPPKANVNPKPPMPSPPKSTPPPPTATAKGNTKKSTAPKNDVTHKADDKKVVVAKTTVNKKSPPEKKVWHPQTHGTIAYGPHPRQKLDFYLAKAYKPTPVVFFVHGGGWKEGDKHLVGDVRPYMKAGISVVSVNYRFTRDGVQEGIYPPVKAPLDDIMRALQFVRYKSPDWNINTSRIGISGESAGACSSLWLALHNDMANPFSPDPIARQSTRVYCAAVHGPQTTLDPKDLRSWLPNYWYGAHAFGMRNFRELEHNRNKIAPLICEYSPIDHVSADDPPVALFYHGHKFARVGGVLEDPTHSPVMGMKLQEKLQHVGVECLLSYAGHPMPNYANVEDYLLDRLRR